MSSFSGSRRGTGTREWSDRSYNICVGCQHGCLYCYAKRQRNRIHPDVRRIPSSWRQQRLNPRITKFGAEVGRGGVVMFPTSHDITPRFLPKSVRTIRNILKHNTLIILSKPHLPVVRALCREFADHKESLLFRFTIGTLNRKLAAFWEPGAPAPAERIRALKHAFRLGFKTSVSAEPMIGDADDTVELVNRVSPYVTDTVWIGKMGASHRATCRRRLPPTNPNRRTN